MNWNTGIEWVVSPDGKRGATWNPIYGCYGPGGTKKKPNRCWYCYAEEFAGRGLSGCAKCKAFIPHIHRERLDEPKRRKKPATIFVGSMSDMWGDWVPREWIESVLDVIRACPQHTFLALTKNPKRYEATANYLGVDLRLDNLWCGVTITNTADTPKLLELPYLWYELPRKFISFEPLLDDVAFTIEQTNTYEEKIGLLLNKFQVSIDAVIIGPLNKRDHDPVTKREWVENITRIADEAGVPVFYKDALWKKGVMTKAEVRERQRTPWGG